MIIPNFDGSNGISQIQQAPGPSSRKVGKSLGCRYEAIIATMNLHVADASTKVSIQTFWFKHMLLAKTVDIIKQMLTIFKLQGLEWKQHAYRIPFHFVPKKR